ncbi:MAG: tetratricopeptide repeat protein [Acidobacteriota bacterium]|nr:tetratricopeptide repeat protein [Acidobacteriota bacterium]
MRTLLAFVITLSALSAVGQKPKLENWPKLIDSNKCKDAEQLCSPFASSSLVTEKVEAQKCLANVALCGHSALQLQGDDTGGGSLGEGYDPKAVDAALTHLNAGIQLAPQDATLHEGRLHVLEVSTRYEEMVKALDESCTVYKGKDAPDIWLAYAPELMDLRQFKVALEFMKVLDKHYPNSPDILGNIGAFLDMLKRDSEAIPYLQKAVALAPKDPINVWDLARAYDYEGQTTLADSWYQKALPLQSDPKQKAEMSCLYAKFVDQKLHDTERACSLEKSNCNTDDQSACHSTQVPVPTSAPPRSK